MFYALVQGRIYQGDIEGERYHWRAGIPGSQQLVKDLETGNPVSFIYYRTWDAETKKGKYFYGAGEFDGKSLTSTTSPQGQTEYLARIVNYTAFSVPFVVDPALRVRIWNEGNRQPGIKRIAEDLFRMVKNGGEKPEHINNLSSVLGERDLEGLLNDQIDSSDIKDLEGHQAAKRAVRTEVYKRSQKTIKQLKAKYTGLCQITGSKLSSLKDYEVDVTEAHHINYLCDGGLDGTPSNIIIISPEWHRLLHKRNPKFDKATLSFVFENGKVLPVRYPGHLRP